MKLYLSSYRIPEAETFVNFVGKQKSDISIGLVLNAQDYKPKEEREAKKNELFTYFKGFGFYLKEIDLRKYGKQDELRGDLNQCNVLWFNGGNTFCLRWAIERSILTKAMLEKVLESGVVYAGDSAGAVIMGPTLKYFDSADDPQVVQEVMYDALGFVDFVVLPHWGSKEYGEVIKKIGERLRSDGYNTKSLTDDEFITVEDNEVL